MTKMIFLYGLPAAGKTTFAKKFVTDNPDFVRISADDVRKELYGSEDIRGDSREIYSVILDKMKRCLDNDKSFIYDGTNMLKSYRMDYLHEFKDYDIERIIIKFPMDKVACLTRFFNRNRKIPFGSVSRYYTMVENPPTLDEGWDRIYTLEAYK